MTAEVHALPRHGSGGRSPLVPAKVQVQDAPDFRFPIRLLDSEWYHSCTREEALAGINLQARAIHQERAGSLPNSDAQLARLADFGRDIEGWLAAKGKALEGWVLCADDRWHHPDVARNVLHIWIGRLERRRIGAYGNASRDPDGRDYGLASIQDDIDDGLAALRSIDPQDGMLREASARARQWRQRLAKQPLTLVEPEAERAAGNTLEPNRHPNRLPNRTPPGGIPKVSEAKRSEAELSSPQRGDDSSTKPEPTIHELEENGCSVERTPSPSARQGRASPWPPGWLELFKERFPRKQAWGRAEKALERIRKAGRIPFEEILAGVDRLVLQGRPREYTPLPVTWLNDRGWEDEIELSRPGTGVLDRTNRGTGPPRNPHFAFAESLLDDDP